MALDTEPSLVGVPPSLEQPESTSHQRIIMPNEFYEILSGDNALKESIAGVLTVSLRHLQKTPQGYSVPTFTKDYEVPTHPSSVNIDLVPDVFESVFGEKPLPVTTEKLIEQNRSHGRFGSLRDIIMSKSYAPSSHHRIGDEGRLDIIERLVRETEALTDQEIGDKLQDLPEDEVDHLYSLFPSKDELVNALVAAKGRAGVQLVVTDKKKLAKYITENGASDVDDWAAVLHAPVPPGLIKFVIPLGKYEQSVLLPN